MTLSGHGGVVKSFGRISLALIVAGSTVGCGGSPAQPSWDGQVLVAGFVLDFPSNSTIGGARVTIAS